MLTWIQQNWRKAIRLQEQEFSWRYNRSVEEVETTGRTSFYLRFSRVDTEIWLVSHLSRFLSPLIRDTSEDKNRDFDQTGADSVCFCTKVANTHLICAWRSVRISSLIDLVSGVVYFAVGKVLQKSRYRQQTKWYNWRLIAHFFNYPQRCRRRNHAAWFSPRVELFFYACNTVWDLKMDLEITKFY